MYLKLHFRKFHKDPNIQVQIISDVKDSSKQEKRKKSKKPKANSLIDETGVTASNSPNKEPNNNASLSDLDKALEELEKIEKTTIKIFDGEETSKR